ncbi:TANFOR domain [Algoriella xinjiangensis]|uniref:glycohydrolase toxin TNT-related protein n=1 Tax=Algoriella xinjiangensis TaxID=684065 RepID=UPI000F64421A|nr:fibronectin type III domain-containing protein [Algoriella xinjiangensis]VDH15449.1 TANFOR domain [Algoriella xinjiangensis]
MKNQITFKRFLVLSLLFLLQFVQAQQYPVQVTPVLIPPYSLKLGDYATTNENKLQIQLLMTDLMEPTHQVRLRFSLESGLNSTPIAISNQYINGMRDITLSPGVPLILTNVELRALFQLQNLSGISTADYAKTLPQGQYNFCFEVVDSNTGRTLSRKSCSTAYFVQYDPPMLSLPQNKELVQKQNEIQNIVFQWMPRQLAPNTRYIFTMKEIWDLQRDPITAFLASPVLWKEEVYSNSLFYGFDKTQLLPGKRYAWQVQAKSGNPVLGGNPTEDNGVYKNNGLSEIFYFDYIQDCKVPTFLSAKNAGRGRVEVRWSYPGEKPNGLYRIQYRKKGSSTAWMEQEAYQEMIYISGLADKTEYEYRVGAVCGLSQTYNNGYENGTDNAYSYSNTQYFTTDSEDTSNNVQCGMMPDINITNKAPLQDLLAANDVFTAGDFPVTIIKSVGNGTYTGGGYIVVPYLADTKVKVSFSNIQINTDRQLISGIVETTYDPKESAVHYVSEIWDGFGDGGIKEINVDFPIDSIVYSATPPPGTITVMGPPGKNGETPPRQTYSGGGNTTIKDPNGNIWEIDKDGNITKSGQVAPGGASTSQNTDGVSGSGKDAVVNQYTAKGIELIWQTTSATKFAFDTKEQTGLPISDYQTVKDSKGQTIAVPYKLVVNGQTDILQADIKLTDASLKDAQIEFKTLSIGKKIEATETKLSDTNRRYDLTLKGAYNYQEEDIIAVLIPKDSLAKQQVISSFKLVHLGNKKPKVHLVPLDNKSKSDITEIRKNLTKVYKGIGVDFDIVEEEILPISELGINDKIESGDPKLMSTYGSDQKKINNHYLNTRSKELRYVLFITDKQSSTGQAGYMRLNGQFGYVFKNAPIKTAAHELGHGVFKLEHPTTSKTKLLMDNSESEILSHLDWKQIGDPAFKFYGFQDQSEGEQNRYAHLAITSSGEIFDEFYKDGKEIVVTILVAKDYVIDTLKYKDIVYKWNKTTKIFEAEGQTNITIKKIDKTINDEVNLFRSKGDNCTYDYVTVKWTEADEKASDIKARIQDKIKNFTDDNWKVSPLDIRDGSCSNVFIPELLGKDRKDCSEADIQTGIISLREALKLTDGERVATVVNGTCLTAIRNLKYAEIEKLIDLVASQETLKEFSEVAILRLMNAIKEDNYKDYYKYLEAGGNKIIKKFVKELDDTSVFFWDGNNYTNFMGALVTMYNKNPKSIEDRWPASTDDFAKITVNLNPIEYEKGETAYFQIYKSKYNDGEYDEQTGNVKINDVFDTTSRTNGAQGTVSETELIVEVSPLTPIILIPDTDHLPLVETALGENTLGTGAYIVPAIFLKYKSDKIKKDYIEKGVMITLDLATIYFSGGTALATKVTWIRRGWAMAEVVGAVGNISVNTGTVNPNSNLGKAINAYNIGMGVIGLKNLTVGGYKFVKSLPEATKKLLQENKGLRNLLIAQYTEWKIATTNLGEITPAQRKVIDEQEQVWKTLGIWQQILDDMPTNFFNNVNDMATTFDEYNKISSALRGEIYNLYKQKKWSKLEQIFKENKLNAYWPPANGGYNIIDNVILKKGMKFDRYGDALRGWDEKGIPPLGGEFTSPIIDGKLFSFGERALNRAESGYNFYYEIEVIKEIPFNGEAADVIPWFGQIGNGKQMRWKIPIDPLTNYPKTWNKLAEEGYIRIIIKDSPSGKYKSLINQVIGK